VSGVSGTRGGGLRIPGRFASFGIRGARYRPTGGSPAAVRRIAQDRARLGLINGFEMGLVELRSLAFLLSPSLTALCAHRSPRYPGLGRIAGRLREIRGRLKRPGVLLSSGHWRGEDASS
jgi:hypothetical protein